MLSVFVNIAGFNSAEDDFQWFLHSELIKGMLSEGAQDFAMDRVVDYNSGDLGANPQGGGTDNTTP